MSITVEPVRDSRDLTQFLKLPYSIYGKDHPQYVFPLLGQMKAFLNKEKNPFFRHAETELWVAREGKEPVGRIAAAVDRTNNEHHQESVGFFGFYEATENPEVATALVGFRNKADVDSAIDAVERFQPLTSAEIDALKSHILTTSEGLCTQCNYCDVCPEEIPVLRLMEAYNHHKLNENQPDVSIERLKWNWNIPDVTTVLDSCTECRQCEEACTQRLPILERFEALRQDHAKVLEEREKKQRNA